MKKSIITVLTVCVAILAGTAGTAGSAVAAGNACFNHGGVNCAAGPALFGYARCNDNTTSSIMYPQAQCASDEESGCISPSSTGCVNSAQLRELQNKFDEYYKSCTLQANISVYYYTGCSFPSLQRQIQVCSQQIQDRQIQQQAYSSCIKTYYQTILDNTSATLAMQLEQEQKICAQKGYVWDVSGKKCVSGISATVSPAPATQPAYGIESNIGIGARGSDVVSLQIFLQDKGFLKIPAGVAMGYFGSLTRNAVVAFQKSANLPATGYCGPLTRAAISNSR